jgi:hypothetical protein
MPIVLDEKYHITVEKTQVVLHFYEVGEVNPETEKPTIRTDISYHATLAQAIKKYCAAVSVRGEDINAVARLLQALDLKIDAIFGDIQRNHLKP